MRADTTSRARPRAAPGPKVPDRRQVRWLARGLSQPGGKLPLFDEDGRRVDSRVVRACLRAGWAEPWFRNPLKPDWEVCRLTEDGRAMLAAYAVVRVDFGGSRARTQGDSMNPADLVGYEVTGRLV